MRVYYTPNPVDAGDARFSAMMSFPISPVPWTLFPIEDELFMMSSALVLKKDRLLFSIYNHIKGT